MREVFAHQAVVSMEPDGDIRAPMAAITVALCGHWEHEPPCPLAPHHTQAKQIEGGQIEGGQIEGGVSVRILFATEAGNETEVRRRINAALTGGPVCDSGVTLQWRLLSSRPSDVMEEEAEHGQRLLRS